MSLTRIAIGPVVLKGLSSGEHRPLSRGEIDLLRKVAAGVELSQPHSSEHRSRGPSSPPPGPRRSSDQPEQREHRAPRGRGRIQEQRPRPDRAPRAAQPPSLPARQKPSPRDHSPRRPMPGKLIPGMAMQGKPMPGRPAQDSTAKAVSKVRPGLPVSPPALKPAPTTAVKPKASLPLPASEPKAAADKPPSSEAKPARRIIGLDPKIAEEAGLSLSGRPARKRPAIARRPPRKVLGVKRSGAGEDEL